MSMDYKAHKTETVGRRTADFRSPKRIQDYTSHTILSSTLYHASHFCIDIHLKRAPFGLRITDSAKWILE